MQQKITNEIVLKRWQELQPKIHKIYGAEVPRWLVFQMCTMVSDLLKGRVATANLRITRMEAGIKVKKHVSPPQTKLRLIQGGK